MLTFMGLIPSNDWFLYVCVDDRFNQIKMHTFTFVNIGSVLYGDNVCGFPAGDKNV